LRKVWKNLSPGIIGRFKRFQHYLRVMDAGEILIYIVCYFGLLTSIYFLLTLYENRNRIAHPKATKFPKVTVIVPAYNEEKTIAKTIRSLLNLDYPKLQIIVIDDGSTDSTYRIAKTFRGIEVYKKKNGGKAAALNLGLKKAKGELVGALDADSFVDKNALRNMIGYFEDERIVAVTPSLRVYKPKTILQKIQRVEYLIGIFLRKVFSFIGSIHVTPGPFTIYRKSFFDKHGGYDENNLTEDIEVALRIQSIGGEIENSVESNVYTVSPYHFKPLLNQRLRWYLGFIENVYRYRHVFSPGHGNLGLIVLPAAFISVILVILMMFYSTYMFLDRAFKDLLNYQSIGFDWTRVFELNFDLFFVNLERYTLLTIITLIIGVCILVIARNLAKENERIRYHYLFYTLFYWFLFGFWWLGAIFLKITGKRIYWGKKKV
jgi:cellulose synthase/poly-beta-1,6-N-acetylglucosamine synthase-like glycosyltransferase